MQTIRAIYEHGHFRLLEPVDLQEGAEIELIIASERERVRDALSDLLVPRKLEVEDELDEDALQAEIDAELRDKPSISDVIVEKRREGSIWHSGS